MFQWSRAIRRRPAAAASRHRLQAVRQLLPVSGSTGGLALRRPGRYL